ncbi:MULTISPECIES: hypothetical protein [unclassified Moraxella]|uniref:hypothetical protein n=1 Tax=unclassified Moraxella TaxID=2685852 RepID=UPI003AF9BE31
MTTLNLNQTFKDIQSLPYSQQSQVANFVNFLKSDYQDNPIAKKKPKSTTNKASSAKIINDITASFGIIKAKKSVSLEEMQLGRLIKSSVNRMM